jgi:hypothetical protein
MLVYIDFIEFELIKYTGNHGCACLPWRSWDHVVSFLLYLCHLKKNPLACFTRVFQDVLVRDALFSVEIWFGNL